MAPGIEFADLVAVFARGFDHPQADALMTAETPPDWA